MLQSLFSSAQALALEGKHQQGLQPLSYRPRYMLYHHNCNKKKGSVDMRRAHNSGTDEEGWLLMGGDSSCPPPPEQGGDPGSLFDKVEIVALLRH
jgi:hypothetical protein